MLRNPITLGNGAGEMVSPAARRHILPQRLSRSSYEYVSVGVRGSQRLIMKGAIYPHIAGETPSHVGSAWPLSNARRICNLIMLTTQTLYTISLSVLITRIG
jgi:hypothetical protein